MDFINANYQQQTDQVNQHPLSQQAKKALITAREKPDPTIPYPPQLMRWGVQNNKVKMPGIPARQDDLKEMVMERLLEWDNPQEVLAVLTTNYLGEPVNLVEKGPISPLWLALALLDQLNSRMIEAGMFTDQLGKDYD